MLSLACNARKVHFYIACYTVALVGFGPTPLEILSFLPLPVGLKGRFLCLYSNTSFQIVKLFFVPLIRLELIRLSAAGFEAAVSAIPPQGLRSLCSYSSRTLVVSKTYFRFFCKTFVCVYTLYFNNLHWSRIWQCSIMVFCHFVAFGYVRFWIT